MASTMSVGPFIIPPRVTSLPSSRAGVVSAVPSRWAASEDNIASIFVDPDSVSDADLALGGPGPVIYNDDSVPTWPEYCQTPLGSPWSPTFPQSECVSHPVSKRDTPVLCRNRDTPLTQVFAAYSQSHSPSVSPPQTGTGPDMSHSRNLTVSSADADGDLPGTRPSLDRDILPEDLHQDCISMYRDDQRYSLLVFNSSILHDDKTVGSAPALQDRPPSSIHRLTTMESLVNAPSSPPKFDLSSESRRIPFSGIDTRHNSVYDPNFAFNERPPPLPTPAMTPNSTTPHTPVTRMALPMTPQLSPKAAVFLPLVDRHPASRPCTPSHQRDFRNNLMDLPPVTTPRPEPGQWIRGDTPISHTPCPSGALHLSGTGAPSCNYCNLIRGASNGNSSSHHGNPARATGSRMGGTFSLEDRMICRACGIEGGCHRERCPLTDQAPFVSVFEDDDEKASLMEYIRNKCRGRKSSGAVSPNEKSVPVSGSGSWTGSGANSPNKRACSTSHSPLPSVADGSAGQVKSRSQSRKWLHRLSCAVRRD